MYVMRMHLPRVEKDESGFRENENAKMLIQKKYETWRDTLKIIITKIIILTLMIRCC